MEESLLAEGWDHFSLYRAQPDTEAQPAATRSVAVGGAIGASREVHVGLRNSVSDTEFRLKKRA